MLLDCCDGRSLLQNRYSEELAVADPLARAPTSSSSLVEADGDVRLIYLLAMFDYHIERLVVPASRGHADGRTWKLLDKSVRFYRALESMLCEQELREHELVIIGVVDGVVFLRQCGALLSIDLETMTLTHLSEEAKTRAWPPSFLKPAGSGT